MVDVSDKTPSSREAKAQSMLTVPAWLTDHLLREGQTSCKGPVFHTAIIAGTMAAKHTSSLIPLCHVIGIDHVSLDITVKQPGEIVICCSVKTVSRTGVEMEALMGASIAALTIYDMCKSLTFDMEITKTKLLQKTGGKHDRGCA